MTGAAVRTLAAALGLGLAGILAPMAPATASAIAGLPESMSDQGVLSGATPVLAHLPGSGPLSTGDLRVEAGGLELSLDGALGEGIADRAAALLAANPGVIRLLLTSDGGLVDEAEALGRIVAAHGLSTSVTGVCASACTLVYVRGYRRYLGPKGRLGFHGPFVEGFLDGARSVDAPAERHAYIRAGLGPEFVARALSGAPEAMWYPTQARLRAVGVVTDIARPTVPVANIPGRRQASR